MDIPRPSKIQRIALWSIVVIQMVHTLYWLIHHYALEFPPETLDGIQQPFVKAVFWGRVTAWLVALLVGIVLLRALWMARAWAWIGTLIILITSGAYLVWLRSVVQKMRDIDAWDAILFLPLFYGFFALWASRRAFSIRMADLIQVAVAAILASIVIFLDAVYFPDSVTDWAVPVPFYVYLLADSDFSSPQEMTLVLFWSCYAGVTSTVWCLMKARKVKLVK